MKKLPRCHAASGSSTRLGGGMACEAIKGRSPRIMGQSGCPRRSGREKSKRIAIAFPCLVLHFHLQHPSHLTTLSCCLTSSQPIDESPIAHLHCTTLAYICLQPSHCRLPSASNLRLSQRTKARALRSYNPPLNLRLSNSRTAPSVRDNYSKTNYTPPEHDNGLPDATHRCSI